jgi:hypothetical protein
VVQLAGAGWLGQWGAAADKRVVIADPNAPQLTDEQRQSVRELLVNDDGNHKSVIGAS